MVVNMADISESDRRLIEELRSACKHLLTPDYDRDYNILRFLKGWGYNKDAALYHLQRHLRSRKAFEMDKMEETLIDDDIIKYHFPSGLLGTTGKDNKLVMVDCAGRTDIDGLMKSIQATEFFRYRIKFFERVYASMYEQERATGRQSGVVYVFDLEGLSMNPFLLGTLNGPYRILWGLIMVNYPEWIHVTLVVNVPAFFSVLWTAFGPIIPEGTRKKVKLLDGADWKKKILDYIDPDHLPVNWGGRMVDQDGDTMCRSKIVVPQGKIPPSLYWRNVDKYKPLPEDQTNTKNIGAGTFALWSYSVPDAGTVIDYYIETNSDYTFAIYYCQDQTETDITAGGGKMEDVFPPVEVPGGLAPDKFHFVCDRPGAYHIKLGNEKAWLFSSTVKYRWRFAKPDGTDATNVQALNET